MKHFLTISLLFLVGCSSHQPVEDVPDVQTVVKWRTVACPEPPDRDPVKFRPVTWAIVDGRFTLEPDHYANLGDNMSDILKATEQLKTEIRYYLDCISSQK